MYVMEMTDIIRLLSQEIDEESKKDVHINNQDYHIWTIDGIKIALQILKNNQSDPM